MAEGEGERERGEGRGDIPRVSNHSSFGNMNSFLGNMLHQNHYMNIGDVRASIQAF